MPATYALAPRVSRLSDSFFRQVIDKALVGMLVAEDREIIYANGRCAPIFGRRGDQLIGLNVDFLIRPVERKSEIDRFEDSISPSDLSTLRTACAVRPDGSVRELETQTARETVDGRQVSIVSIVDVTERNLRLEAAIDSHFEEWRGTFDAVNTPIVITRADGIVVRMNRAACELSGLPETNCAGRSIADVSLAEPLRTAAQMVRYISDERSGTSAETRDSQGRTWDINIEYFSRSADRGERYILVFWNITGTVELQESLRRSETMSAMGKIVAGVAHEVRNPLFGISATLDAYAEELSRPGYEECAAALNGEVKRLTHLMQDLLEYGKPAALHVEAASLHDVIAEVAARHARSTIAVENLVPASLPSLLMDRSRMREVFDNLIENAEQNTPAGSIVRVIGSVVDHGGRQWVECCVEDNGPGFNPEDLERLFDPFFTRREGGTGLGLSIVERIIHEHSGKVFAGNGAEGAVVRILLPFTQAQD